VNPVWIGVFAVIFLLVLAVNVAILVGIAVGAIKVFPPDPSTEGIKVTRFYEPEKR